MLQVIIFIIFSWNLYLSLVLVFHTSINQPHWFSHDSPTNHEIFPIACWFAFVHLEPEKEVTQQVAHIVKLNTIEKLLVPQFW